MHRLIYYVLKCITVYPEKWNTSNDQLMNYSAAGNLFFILSLCIILGYIKIISNFMKTNKHHREKNLLL